MTIFLLAIWTCVLIYGWLVQVKYRNTRVIAVAILVFIALGLLSTYGAALLNMYLMKNTQFHFVMGSPLNRFLSFLLGAGFGEELWKMGAGAFLVMIFSSLGFRLGNSGRILGLVTIGLAFAAAENLMVYSRIVDELGMIRRSYLAVPLHVTMGYMHGVAINSALQRNHVWPLFVGYAVTSAIHAFYDTITIILQQVATLFDLQVLWARLSLPNEMTMGPITLACVVWCVVHWRHNVSELLPEWERKAGTENEWMDQAETWE